MLTEGYVDAVLEEPLLQVVHDASLGDLLEQDHVVHPTGLDIVTLPVVLGLWTEHSHCTRVHDTDYTHDTDCTRVHDTDCTHTTLTL